MAAKRISKPESLLAALGIIGMEPIEPVILGALIGGEPLLLVGPHGTGKSYLLTRISAALGLELRHYNASLLNYDDLVGYPLPNGRGGLEFIQTPASIWGANAVFIDEISRCRPDLQNKLFPIIHERRVQGILLDKLLYRWSAMNPPPPDEGEVQEPFYRGSEPLDTALADRFAFVVVMPAWNQFSESQQEQVILCAEDGAPDESSRRLKVLVENGRALLASVRQELSGQVARYVRAVTALLAHAGVETSPRRAGMLLRNILAVHAADLARNLEAEAAASAYLALSHSLILPGMKVEVIGKGPARPGRARITGHQPETRGILDDRGRLPCGSAGRRAARSGRVPLRLRREREARGGRGRAVRGPLRSCSHATGRHRVRDHQRDAAPDLGESR